MCSLAKQPSTSQRATRTCSWTIRPFSTPSGGRLGFLSICVGRVRDEYRVTLQDQDWACETWLCEKEQADGTFAAPGYLVTLPAAGNTGRASCTCRGFEFQRSCRHTLALAAALKATVV